MTRIPRELIRHLEWSPGQEVPVIDAPKPAPAPAVDTAKFSIDDLINNGKHFYSNKQNSDGSNVGVPIALREALEYAGSEGIVPSMPYLIAGKAKADTSN